MADITRPVYLNGAESDSLKDQLQKIQGIVVKNGNEFHSDIIENCFLIGVCDFDDMPSLQKIAKIFTEVESTNVQKVLYSRTDTKLSQEHLFCTMELGAKITVHGKDRLTDLKSYLERSLRSQLANPELSSIESDLEKAAADCDDWTLKEIADRLTDMSSDDENVLYLQAKASQYQMLPNKVIFYLKKLLEINPQNLWATNALGRQYLQANRVSEGIEVLEKLSEFHELNGERLLHLGNAYLKTGANDKATNAFDKGSNLNGGGDMRFSEGSAKAQVNLGNVGAALRVLGKKSLSPNVMSFLNMKAMMAIRNKQLEKGMSYYEMGIEGSSDDVTKAKIKFNMGLAYARAQHLEEARECFEESLTLGGNDFRNAEKPLEMMKKMIEKAQNEADKTDSAAS